MKESMRRIVLFAVIVVTGSVMILFDIPLILMIPFIIVVGFVLLVVLGAIPVAELRGSLAKIKLSEIRKIPALKKLDEIKLFEKKAPGAVATAKPAAPVKAAEKKPSAPEGKGPGPLGHIKTLFASIGSLGTVLGERSKRGRKVEDINKMLDKTVKEKVTVPPPTEEKAPPLPTPAGGAGGGAAGSPEIDPFLSLSTDEFDAGLLDGLEEQDAGPLGASAPAEQPAPLAPLPDTGTAPGSEGEMPMPPMDFSAEAGDIIKENAPGLEEFSGMDGGESIDADFGDLDNLNLDDVTLEEDGVTAEQSSMEPAAAPAAAAPAAGSSPAVKEIKTDWIQSDAPKEGGDDVSTHADMAAFSAGATGTDEDLLSSIASDVKHTKKEKDVSLLRELKDFKAPAEEIEQELTQMYQRLDAAKEKTRKAAEKSVEIK